MDVEKERRAKESAELQSRRLQTELRTTHQQVSELSEQLTVVQQSKDNLEAELDRIADGTESADSVAKMQRQYNTSRLQRSADKVARDAKFQLAESDRQKAKLEEERKAYEAQLRSLRQALDAKVPFVLSSLPSIRSILYNLGSKPKKTTSSPPSDAQSERQETISRKPSSTPH